MKWLALIIGSLVVLVVSMTALDKYDERTCIMGEVQVNMVLPGSDEQPVFKHPSPASCDGFLPW
jgi:hypothetical protein